MAAKISRSRPHLARVDDGIVVIDSSDRLAPTEREYREERPRIDRGPRTAEEFAEAFEEMAANDPEFRAWRSAERLGDLVGGRP